jgi:hypothetical protein
VSITVEDLAILHTAKSPACTGAVIVQKRTLLTGSKYLVCSKCGARL